MAMIEIYSSATCAYCTRAKQLLDQLHVTYQELRVDLDPAARDQMVQRSGRRTVPQIFINDRSIGGFDELWALHQSGELALLLANSLT